MNFSDYDYDNRGYSDPLFPPDLFNQTQKRYGAWLLYAIGSLVTVVAAVIINNRFVVEGVRVGVEKIRNRLLRSVLSSLLVGGARSYPKFVIAQLAHNVAYSDIGLGAVLGSIAFTLHVVVGLSLINFKRNFGTQKEVLLNCLLMLAASGFGWAILTQESAFTAPPKLLSVLAFIVFYLVISLLPLCCKMREEAEGDLPLHEQEMKGSIQNVQTDSSSPEDISSSSLFKAPPGILRTRGSSLVCLVGWCNYVATLATALIPSLSMFCCDPVSRPNTRLWPLAVIGGALWVPGLLYLTVWWVTVVGETWGIPPELMGVAFVGPILASSALPLLARPSFVLQESSEILLNDILYGTCFPFLLYFIAHGSYPVQSWESSDLICFHIQMIILLTHLV